MISEAMKNFLDIVTKYFFSCSKSFFFQQEHFSYCQEKYLVPRKKNLGSRKKLFRHFINENFLAASEKVSVIDI